MTDIEIMLVAFADGELDVAAVAEVECILAADPCARRSLEIYRSTAVLLRAAGAYATVPSLERAPRARRRTLAGQVLVVTVSVAALLLGFASGFRTVPRPDGFLDDVAQFHAVLSHETTHLAEVSAGQADEIARWLGGRLQRPIVGPDLRAAGLRFGGARMLVSDSRPVADLLYTREGGLPVALCIVHGAVGTAEPHLTARGELRIVSWMRDGYTFALVGEMTDVNARDVAVLAAAQTSE